MHFVRANMHSIPAQAIAIFAAYRPLSPHDTHLVCHGF
jgi:hypothetical protein